MYLADRIREIREGKNLSQGDIERRTGLLRCYISRVENGHTVPALETLEKFARALEVPLYQFFYAEDSPITKPRFPVIGDDWASERKGRRVFHKLCRALSRTSERDRRLLLAIARQMKNGKGSRKS
jgi:transcriptional regulator with XRE-family HTH domain